MLRAELIKLRRSSTWLVAVVLPLLAVITGSINYAANQGVLTEGWLSLASQVTIFYGMFFFAVGISILVAVTWRPEHREGAWNLMATSTDMLRLMVVKVVVTLLPVVVMQVVLVCGILIAGIILRTPGAPPAMLSLILFGGVLGALPVVAFQQVLSVLNKSFAVPVALGFLAVFGALAITTTEALRPLAWVTPQALLTRAVSLGSTALTRSGGAEEILPLSAAALLMTVVITLSGTAAARYWRFR